MQTSASLAPVYRSRLITAPLWTSRIVLLALTFLWSSLACKVNGQAVPIFVTLRTTQVAAGSTPTSATTATIAPPPSGWAYSAAAPVPGTTWNQILRPNPGIASGVGAVAGTFVMNSANNIALTAANGSPTTVRLTGTIVIGDTTGATRTEPATGGGGSGVLAPVGLMDGAWRIFSGTNTTRFTFTGLPANAHYYLYCYGASGASGCLFGVPSPFLASDDTTPKTTTGGNSGNLFVTDSINYSLYPGPSVLWTKFHVITDATGTLAVTTAKNSSSQQFFNGFQLRPYPVATITLPPPAEITATIGGNVSIPVTATGDGTLTYLWRKDGAPLAPATNPSAATSTLSLSNVQTGDAGSYDVVITNQGGSIISSPTAVTVGNAAVAPTISIPPANQTAVTGGNITFNVVANGTAPLSYLWQKSTDNVAFVDIPNSNSVQLALSAVQTTDAGYYRVIVSNPVGSATSSVATLAVAPVITAQPVGGTAAPGSSATLSVGADVGAGAPAPTTYAWKKNGTTVVVDGSGISGATTPTLQFTSFTIANSGVYTVTVSNIAGSVTSKSVYLGTPTTLTNTLWPANNATGVNRDTPPTIKFSNTPIVGTVGQVRVYDASNDALVETIDLSTLTLKVGGVQSYRHSSKTIGDRTYHYFPIVVVGNEARIALKSSTTLAYNKTYYVQIDPGVLLDSSGASFSGINDKTTWRFTTKPSGLANTATAITVAADGSGDFTTLQGAIDLIPFSPANTTPRKITLKSGIYNEQINLRIGQNNITIQGAGRASTVIQYLNNNDLLPPGGAHFTARSILRTETNDFTLNDVTVRNLTLKGGGQAEAIAAQGSRITISRCNFYSFQDTLFIGEKAFVTDCYVEGDVDFIWGGNAFFQRCEFKMMFPGYNSNPRNGPTQIGYVFVDCKFTRSSAAAVPNGSGYFSRDFGSADSMFALFNCYVDRHIANVGWNVSATDLTKVRYWEYNSKNLDGTPYDTSVRPTWNHMSTGAPGAAPVLDHQQVDAITAAYYSNAVLVSGFTPAVAPAIDTQPTNQTVDAGSNVVLSVGATVGYPAAAFQWLKNGVAIDAGANPSAATPQLSLANVQVADIGIYTVVISNSAGTVTSSPAAVLINGQPPLILTQPAGQIVAPGGAVSLTVNAISAVPLSYQWNFNGAPVSNGTAADGTVIAGATTSTVSLSNTQPGYEGSYTVTVTDANGSTTSNAASLVVDAIPTITTQPISQVVTAGSSVTFTVAATGATTYQYQWQRNGTAIPGASTTTLALNNVTVTDSANYTAVVSSRAGSATSVPAALTVSQFALPNIPGNAFDATSFGAVGDNNTDNTSAIQNAINAANSAGGGTISIPAGTFLCGPINLGSNTHLALANGCILKMLPMGQWPNAPYLTGSTPPFIKAESVHDVQVSGGLIDGQGQAWWDRVDGTNGVTQQPTVRPGTAISFSNVTRGAMIGVATLNTPNINVQVSNNSRYVVLSKVSITDPENSPNTDGIHLAGRDLLIDHCTVNNGDDNIVINTGNSGPETSDITITNCTLLTGHGCSIGSFTSASGRGIKNVKVSGVTFNGTTAGINLKSAPGRGGVVQNLEYSNLVMTNVGSPFSISSYYGTVGNAGATGSSRITPAVVNAYNATPPVSLNTPFLVEWKNITISDVTITGSTNYSTIWGLPNKPLNGITFKNIKQTGGFGFQIYNAQSVLFTGNNSFALNAGQPTFTTCNANVITSQPQSQTIENGATAAFSATAIGASGLTNTPPTYQWALNGAPLADGARPDDSIVSGATTLNLSVANARGAEAGSYTLTMSNLLDTYNVSTSSFAANSLPAAATSEAAVLTVKTLPATVTLSNLAFVYDGTPKIPTVQTTPASLPVSLTYNDQTTAPTNAGTYTVVAKITDVNYSGEATATLTIDKATPTLTWATPASIEYGTPLGTDQLNATASTPGEFNYAPSSGTVLNAGTNQPLGVLFTPTDANNFTTANAATTITVTPAPASVSFVGTNQVYDGTPKSVTGVTSPSGLPFILSYAGSATPPTAAGTYALSAIITDPNYTGGGTDTLTISQASASITLGNLGQFYDGTPRLATAITAPAGLNVTFTYNGSSTTPTLPGTYAVIATIDDTNYQGTINGTLVINITALVRHAPAMNGGIDGSIQVLLPESFAFNGQSFLSGDLLVPGTPSVQLNGNPTLGGIIDSIGSASPANYTVTLNSNALVRTIVRRVDPLTLPVVSAPAAPLGTRNVTISNTTQSPGDFATLRNLTLSGTAGLIAVPPGTYGSFTANGSSGFILGVAGASEPAVYNLQSLSLNVLPGSARLQIVGPVVLTLANSTLINGAAGSSTNPNWLTLRIANGGLTISSNAAFYGHVLAPNGTVTLNGNAVLTGTVIADRLILNGTSLLDQPAE